MQQLVLVLDVVVAISEVQSVLFGRTLRGGAAAPYHLQIAVLSFGALWCQGEVTQQAVWQGDVIKVAEGGTGASAVCTAVTSDLTSLLMGSS